MKRSEGEDEEKRDEQLIELKVRSSLYKRPYGLLSQAGIATDGMTPREAWSAVNELRRAEAAAKRAEKEAKKGKAPINAETSKAQPAAKQNAAAPSKTEGEEKARPIIRNYHVAHRADGKWQVKFAKGEKAIKLFDTQEEAIAYAKKLTANRGGNMTIHKKDGSIRKQKY